MTLQVKPTMISTSADFDKLSKEERQCQNDPNFDQTKCAMDVIMNHAYAKCGCIPWYYMAENFEANKTCDTFGSFCFEDACSNFMSNNEISPNTCPQPCKSTKYSVSLRGQNLIRDLNVELYGGQVQDYINSDTKSILLERVINDQLEDKFKLKQLSILDINFEDPQVLVITKDAKATLADKVANIGGTFGLFLGLSFFAIAEFIIDHVSMFLGKNE